MNRFTEDDLAAIKAAVQAAEGETSGEIVPFVAVRSDTYTLSIWKAGVLFALLAVGAFLAAEKLQTGWSAGWLGTAWAVALAAGISGSFGALMAYSVPSMKRLFAGEARMVSAVHGRALKAFVDEEVFDTRERTGILLFVSLFERRIEVLGDAGINAKVSPDDWSEVVFEVRDGIRRDELAQGLVAGIQRCGALLGRKGVERRDDDQNELPDGLRLDT